MNLQDYYMGDVVIGEGDTNCRSGFATRREGVEEDYEVDLESEVFG